MFGARKRAKRIFCEEMWMVEIRWYTVLEKVSGDPVG
jgi:hypothetical protein